MKHVLQSNLIHYVIGVAKNSPLIPDTVTQALFALLSDTAERAGAHQIAAGGCKDHIHLLISLPPTLAPSRLLDEMRSSSQNWMQSNFKLHRPFKWTEAYSGFSVGVSQLRGTIEYVNNQAEFHRRISFNEEMALFGEAYNDAMSPQATCAD